MSENDFAKLLEQSEQQEIEKGQIVKGKIHHITDDTVFIDVGYKSEGTVNIAEFDEAPEIGAEIDVFIDRLEDYSGNIIVSKAKAEKILNEQKVHVAYKDKTPIQGKVISLTETKSKDKKGGFLVDLGIGKDAFCPYSHIDIEKVKDENDYIGKKFDFQISSIERKNTKIVVSRKNLLIDKKEKAVESFFETVQEDEIYEGKVKNIIKHGAFIELVPFVDGFCHISELSWKRVKKPEEIVKVGDEVKVKVIGVEKDKKRVDLSIKALQADPWLDFDNNYFVEDEISGRVIDLKNAGAIIEVEQGIEGFIPISEITWTKKIKHAKEVLSVGQNVKAKIIKIDKQDRNLILGIKQLLDNPWEELEKKYPVGSKVEGKIKNITKFGAFIELDNGIDGLLHKNDLDWNPENADLSNLKKGQTVEVMVLNINKKEQTISLGLKQLEDNPWQEYLNKHPKNSIVTGKVKELMEIGAVIELDGDIEGFIHVSEICKERIESPAEKLKVGDELELLITDANLRKNKISLSVRALERKLENEEIQKYTQSGGNGKATLGEMIDFSKFNIKKEAKDQKEDKK